MTRLPRLLAAPFGALLLVLATVFAAQPAAAAPRSDVDIVAHRGASGVAPENTLAAIRLALKQGADVIENDIMRTSDDQLVIMHDVSLARTTDVEEVFPDRSPWNVSTFTLAEIKRLDAGSWFSPKFAGERVPTLREWVLAVGSAGMLLEAKDPQLYPGIETDIDKELRSMPEFTRALRAGRVTMQAGDEQWLRAYHDLAPDVPIGLLYYGRPTDAELVAASTWLDQANPALGNIDKGIVDRIHELGMTTNVWTVNGGQDMYRAIEWQVDGIITNYPKVLADVIKG
jgi:glycerophosphoryl diester phosphodiesterase